MSSSPVLNDARAIAEEWRTTLDLATLSARALDRAALNAGEVDLIALGKAAPEMAGAVSRLLGTRVRRRFLVSDHAAPGGLVGEHPVPGDGSWRAGVALLDFVARAPSSGTTLLLLSGGASSLCVAPAPPLTPHDLRELWGAALSSGVDVTVLNQLRAATSFIGGGELLRHVVTPRSCTLVLVDNVISGAPWVGSALTYPYRPDDAEVDGLLARLGLREGRLGARLRAAASTRRSSGPPVNLATHTNVVLGEPEDLLRHARESARRRGYRVVDLGAHVHGDVRDVAAEWSAVVRREAERDGRCCVLGVGEVTVRVRGPGRGGRCQELAWRMMPTMAALSRGGAFVARASDGRDFLRDVAGAWVDEHSLSKVDEIGLDVDAILRANDSYRALAAIGQVLPGGPTGWNLCDLYVAALG